MLHLHTYSTISLSSPTKHPRARTPILPFRISLQYYPPPVYPKVPSESLIFQDERPRSVGTFFLPSSALPPVLVTGNKYPNIGSLDFSMGALMTLRLLAIHTFILIPYVRVPLACNKYHTSRSSPSPTLPKPYPPMTNNPSSSLFPHLQLRALPPRRWRDQSLHGAGHAPAQRGHLHL